MTSQFLFQKLVHMYALFPSEPQLSAHAVSTSSYSSHSSTGTCLWISKDFLLKCLPLIPAIFISINKPLSIQALESKAYQIIYQLIWQVLFLNVSQIYLVSSFSIAFTQDQSRTISGLDDTLLLPLLSPSLQLILQPVAKVSFQKRISHLILGFKPQQSSTHHTPTTRISSLLLKSHIPRPRNLYIHQASLMVSFFKYSSSQLKYYGLNEVLPNNPKV